MSITINYNTEISKIREVTCDMCESCHEYGEKCVFCDDTGVQKINDFEINISNGNFFDLMNRLGIDVGGEYCGLLDPSILLDAIYDRMTYGVYDEYFLGRFRQLREVALAYVEAGKVGPCIPFA